MKKQISLSSKKAGRVFVLIALAIVSILVYFSVYMDRFDKTEVIFLSICILVLSLYWHLKLYYVYVEGEMIIVENELNCIKRKIDSIKDIEHVAGFTYRILFTNDSYVFNVMPSFPFYKNFTQAKRIKEDIFTSIKTGYSK